MIGNRKVELELIHENKCITTIECRTFKADQKKQFSVKINSNISKSLHQGTSYLKIKGSDFKLKIDTAHSKTISIIARDPNIIWHIDRENENEICGWCVHKLNKFDSIKLNIVGSNGIINSILCNSNRPDVAKAGLHGSGMCGFNININASIFNQLKAGTLILKAFAN